MNNEVKHADKHRSFLQADAIIWMWKCVARHAQSTQNKKFHIFAISLEKQETLS